MMNANFSIMNFTGRFCCRRRLNIMAWKASRATIAAMQATYSGCSAYPIAADIGCRNSITSAKNRRLTPPTMRRMVLYTIFSSSPSLLQKRKRVVSIPKVRRASRRAV